MNPWTYLFLIFLPHFQLFLVGETDTIHALQTVIVRVPEPVGGRVSSRRKGPDLSRVRYMGTTTQVNQITASVHRGTSAIGNFGLQD